MFLKLERNASVKKNYSLKGLRENCKKIVKTSQNYDKCTKSLKILKNVHGLENTEKMKFLLAKI